MEGIQVMKTLLEELRTYSESDYYPLHMPGHKRQIRPFADPFALDITEIDGFDNLFHAQGILQEAQNRAARLYGAQESFYLINGSSCGILASVSAAVPRGGHILIARNCHKAVYHALLLNDLHASYLYPSIDEKRGISGSIDPEAVRTALQKQPVSAVLITSPTYDGVCSDLEAIAREVHRAGAVLIVDEAHGAHFALHDVFPKSALACGADLVINSVHKTLPAPTQTALLHVQGSKVNRERLKKYLGVYQSSSPSYILMAGIDSCITMLLKNRQDFYDSFLRRLESLRRTLGKMKRLHLVDGREAELNAYDFDRSKVLISTENCSLSGPKLADLLRVQYHLEPEMASESYVTAILTAADTQEGFDRLEQALLAIDEWLCREETDCPDTKAEDREKRRTLLREPAEAVYTIAQTDGMEQEPVLLEESAGRISAEFVYLYPPGIPILVPGERIRTELPALLQYDRALGLSVQGMADREGRWIGTVKRGEEKWEKSFI